MAIKPQPITVTQLLWGLATYTERRAWVSEPVYAAINLVEMLTVTAILRQFQSASSQRLNHRRNPHLHQQRPSHPRPPPLHQASRPAKFQIPTVSFKNVAQSQALPVLSQPQRPQAIGKLLVGQFMPIRQARLMS